MLLEIILATAFVSLFSLVGIVFLSMKKSTMETVTFVILSFAVGSLFAAAFFDLLPEAISAAEPQPVFAFTLAGIIVFFILERIVHWHHEHHDHSQHEKPVATMVLLGDSLHNFFDGIAISASFLSSVELGLTTTFAIVMHEIPQEISDFTLLRYAGYSTGKALTVNFLTALTAIAGALLFFYLSDLVGGFEVYGLAFTAGAFIYIAGTDLLPELHRQEEKTKSAIQLAAMLAGIAVIWLLTSALGV